MRIFMTYAWYGHLKDLKDRPVMIAILVAWGVAFFENCLQVLARGQPWEVGVCHRQQQG